MISYFNFDAVYTCTQSLSVYLRISILKDRLFSLLGLVLMDLTFFCDNFKVILTVKFFCCLDKEFKEDYIFSYKTEHVLFCNEIQLVINAIWKSEKYASRCFQKSLTEYILLCMQAYSKQEGHEGLKSLTWVPASKPCVLHHESRNSNDHSCRLRRYILVNKSINRQKSSHTCMNSAKFNLYGLGN